MIKEQIFMDMSKRPYKTLIVVGIICLLIGGFIGFQLGAYVTLKSVVDIASRFIDAELVEKAIYQYKNNIGHCFAPLNLSNEMV